MPGADAIRADARRFHQLAPCSGTSAARARPGRGPDRLLPRHRGAAGRLQQAAPDAETLGVGAKRLLVADADPPSGNGLSRPVTLDPPGFCENRARGAWGE